MAIVLQFITHDPVVGGFGLIVFVVPGFALIQALGPRPLRGPQLMLVTLGSGLVLAVLIGIIVGVSPNGMDATNVASAELLSLSAAAAIWRWRLEPNTAKTEQQPRRVGIGALLLAVLGLVLGAIGFVVATKAAEDQAFVGFVQFWSVPPMTRGDQVVGVRNVTGLPLNCHIAIDPRQATSGWTNAAIEPGQTWVVELPRSEAPDAGPWELSLHCAAPNGTPFDRRLTINPPT